MNDPQLHALPAGIPAEAIPQLRPLLDALPVALYSCDRRGRITYFNRAAVELWGRTPALGSDADLYCGSHRLWGVDGEPIAHGRCWMALALNHGRDYAGREIVVERPDGTRRRAVAHATVLRDAGGAVGGAINVLVDSTAAHQNEERLSILLDSIDDHFVQYDEDWRYVFVTDKGAAMIGKRRDELLGRCIWDVFPEAVGNAYYHALHRAAATREVVRFEHHYEPFGRWFENHIYPTSGGVTVFATDVTHRKAAEAALRKAEQRHNALLDLVPAGIYWSDAEGQIQFYNRHAAELWGQAPDLSGSVRFCGSLRLYTPDGRPLPHAECPFARVLSDGQPSRGEVAVIERPDGSRITVMVNIDPIRDDAGQLVGAVNVFQDITDRWNAEETRSRLAAIVESSQDAIIGKSLQGVVTSWNAAAERLFGYSAQEMIGQPIHRIYPPERVAEEDDFLARVRAGGRVENFESVRRRKDGRLIDISVTVSPVRDGTGRIVGASTVARDISARKASERALQRHAAEQAALYAFTDRLQRTGSLEEIYEAAIECVHAALRCDRAAVLIADDSGVMRFVAWRRLSEDYRRAVEGHSPWRADDPDPQPVCVADAGSAGFEPALAAVVRAEDIAALAFFPLQIDGRLAGKFMLYYDAPHAFDDGEIEVGLTVARQLSFGIERKRSELALREADRRKDEFLATLAHELRNPLAPIRNSLEVLQRAGVDTELARRARETIDRQSAQLVRLVDDLLDVSRITRNRLELRREPLDVQKVVLSAMETCGPLVAEAGHHITLRLPPEPVQIDGDPVRLAQIFANLINNAAKYTDRGGRIEIAAERIGSEVVVHVRDSGIGIPADLLPHVFDMFVQGERALERSRGGLGIGLTLVQRLVRLHGGRVEARSEGPGCGSEFSVWLPVIQARDGGSIDTEAVPSPQLSRRVLVADDNRDSANSLAELLRLLGHEVRLAYDGEEAVSEAAAFAPDLVLLDLGMPRTDGYAAARRIRAQAGARGITLVALTGWGQDEDRRRTREAGFDAHLVKPIDLPLLQKLVAPASTAVN